MEAAEVLNITFVIGINLLGIFFNSLLIFAILFKSPRQMKTYSFLLLNLAFSDLFSCILAIFLVQRVIPFEDSILYISSGFCQFLGAKACFYGYGMILVLYSHTNWSLLASFIFRLYILKKEAPSRQHVMLALFFISSPSIFQYSIGFFYVVEANLLGKPVMNMFERIRPEILRTGRTIYGALQITDPSKDWKPFVATGMVVVPVVPILLAVFFLRRRILSTLHRQKKLSRRSRNLHGQLLRVLTLQACLPVFYLASMGVYLVQQLGISHNVWLEYGTINLLSMIPCCSPLLPLYFVTSYRIFMSGVFRKGDPERHSDSINTSSSPHLLNSS